MQLKFAFKHRFALFFGLLLSFIIFLCHSCTLNDVFTDDPDIKLTFSDDTLQFDTVFTTMGSTTNYFLAFNKSASKVKISNIRLGNGSQSAYRINVDGINGYEFKDVELWANDSLYIFVEVTIDPTDLNTPFVVQDSVIFETNGNLQYVPLVAWGQNAHFFGPNTSNGFKVALTQDTTWTNDKPYVIYGGIEIDAAHRLTIEAGTRIHTHNGGIIIVDGNLTVNGGIDTAGRVIFQGTRLEPDYDEIPGQWFGIVFTANSKQSHLKNAIIQNGYAGIIVSPDTAVAASQVPNVVLENTVVRNMYAYGLWAMNGNIVGANCLVHNCGTYTALLEGCRATFYSCTFGNMKDANIAPDKPAIRIDNDFVWGQNEYIQIPLLGRFANCIIYGSESLIEDELDLRPRQDAIFDLKIENSLVKTIRQASDTLVNCTVPPAFAKVFENIGDGDYTPKEGSPALSIGNSAFNLLDVGFTQISLGTDLKGNPRSEPWDVGAIER